MKKETPAQQKARLIKANRAKNNGKLICYLCKCEINNEKSAVREHKDNNKNNNNDNNIDIACRRCNYEKNPPKRYVLKGKSLSSEREWGRLNDKLKYETVAMAKNAKAKPLFDKWIYAEMLKHGELGLNDVINSGSFISGVGPDTVKTRYLFPMCSRVAYFHIVGVEGGPQFIKWRPGAKERFLNSQYGEYFKKYCQ